MISLARDFTIDRFAKRRRSLLNEYSTYKNIHRELAENFRPRRGFFTKDSSTGPKVTGQKQHQQVINGTPLRASKSAQSGLQAGVTSPSRPWKRLGPASNNFDQVPGAKEFYAETDRRMDFIFAKSNFYQATHTSYADFVDQGPAAIQVDEHDDEVLRCIVHPIGSWVGAVNSDGRVNVFYRDYRPTGHEMLDKFGEEAFPSALRSTINLDPYKRHDLYNAIEPNPFYQGKPAVGIAGYKFISVWWVKGHEQNFIKVHGYHEFPVMVFRFYRSDTSDVYGSSPGMDVLGDAKQLQHMERKKLRAIDKLIDPPLQAPTSLKSKGVSLVPAKVNYHDGPNKIESLYNLNLPLQYVLQDIESVEKRISEAYFEDLFLMISQTVNRQVTAREIEERHQEKLLMLGPVLESISDELLDPLIDRVVGIMRRKGLLPEAPPELEGQEIKVEYISILAQAQRAVQTVPIEQGIVFVGQGSELFPEMRDRINPDGLVDVYFERIGFPPEATRTIREADGVRQQRATQAAQDRQLDLAAGAAAAAKDASAARLDEPNVLTAANQASQAAAAA